MSTPRIVILKHLWGNNMCSWLFVFSIISTQSTNSSHNSTRIYEYTYNLLQILHLDFSYEYLLINYGTLSNIYRTGHLQAAEKTPRYPAVVLKERHRDPAVTRPGYWESGSTLPDASGGPRCAFRGPYKASDGVLSMNRLTIFTYPC